MHKVGEMQTAYLVITILFALIVSYSGKIRRDFNSCSHSGPSGNEELETHNIGGMNEALDFRGGMAVNERVSYWTTFPKELVAFTQTR
jgi:hypothetical protein